MVRTRAGWIRVTAVAAVAGAVCWLVKWVTIAAQAGGESAIDRTAFAVGLVLVAIGATSLALRLTTGRAAVGTGLACVGAAVLALLLVPGLSILSSAVFGEDTVPGSEGGLAVLAVVSLAVGVTGLRSPAGTGAAIRA